MPAFINDWYDPIKGPEMRAALAAKTKVTILALCADAPGSGKDTLAELLAQYEPGIVIVKFADKLTDEVAEQFAMVIDRESFVECRNDPTLKDSRMGVFRPDNVQDLGYYSFLTVNLGYDPKRPMSIRDHLDIYGTKYQRERMGDMNRYVRAAIERTQELVAKGFIPVITDARFPNEVEAVKALGGTVIKVAADWREGARDGIQDQLRGVPVDATIQNIWADPSAMKGQFYARFRF